ncbi:hypothetical protein V502_01360 [Pseudogymnoascus sp. VKM F-4520 (FW-2644)]|nr:hypothetical protein V502_01360 [Pseudogymnoascus sp. VKM F-4520 (FW-2644)]
MQKNLKSFIALYPDEEEDNTRPPARASPSICRTPSGWPTVSRAKYADAAAQAMTVSAACLEKPGYEYLALSYVWGETKPAKWEGDECADPKPPSSVVLGPSLVNVATTIADAIEVTTALNRRYLWVDQYCIDQEDTSQRQESISQMRRIYEKAAAALVAAAGKDAKHGLPGMHSQMRTRPQTLKVAGVTATRGWTYEEAFLSRTMLVFLDDQVYFECNAAHSCDRISASPGVALLPLFGTTEDELVASLSQDSESYHDLQRWYGNVGSQGPEGHQGLLVMIHKSPKPKIKAQNPVHTTTISVTFASRRSKFPSWSWAGWKGELYFSCRGQSGGPRILENVICHVSFRDSDSGVISRLEDIVQHNKSNRAGPQYPRTLIFEAPVIPLKDLLRNDAYETEVTFHLDVKDIQDSPEYWRRKLTKGKDIQCVWLGKFPDYCIGLVLARNKGGNGNNRKKYSRIGADAVMSGRINDNAFKRRDFKTFEIE